MHRADHWGVPSEPLLHSVVGAVHDATGRYCVGKVDCITTLRSFGHVNNPVTVYLLWADAQRTALDAVALEVTSYPWHERTLYCLERKEGSDSEENPLRLKGRFLKTMHVSPFHEHPSGKTVHAYACDVSVSRAGAAVDSAADDAPPLPFARFKMSLMLFDGAGLPDWRTDNIDGERIIHRASLALRTPSWSRPAPFPVALQTSFRILRQAARIQATAGRRLYEHLTLPSAPVSDVFTMSFGVCVPLALLLGAALFGSLISLLLVAQWLLAGRQLQLPPPARDAFLAAAVTTAVALIVGY
eukprot:TRINITY_DN1704_c0_g2_i1.p1 TRINITY_DN1704_c0_g2~~TRINITY_DN1704_c0_g2_i1.p1  ORF type:complete len:300 (-),score=135.00 TRINITY_DN1704_c0_g2_i1:128-1027(-)